MVLVLENFTTRNKKIRTGVWVGFDDLFSRDEKINDKSFSVLKYYFEGGIIWNTRGLELELIR